MAKFNLIIEAQNEDTIKFHLQKNEKYLSFGEVFTLWQQDALFVSFYKDELIKLNYLAFYWEHPAMSKDFLYKKYECIVQRSKPLEYLPCNERAFSHHLGKKEQVVDFMNLGKDARLVVPTKKTTEEIYNHLGKFIRSANKEQLTEVFKRVGKTIIEELEAQKIIWLNTAGLGVIWLHIRMDTQPKYYKTESYKEPDFLNNC